MSPSARSHVSSHLRPWNARARHLVVVLVASFLFAASQAVYAQNDPRHIWVGKLDRAGAEKWVGDHLMRERKDVDELLAVKGARTLDNTLRPYDNAQNELGVAGSEAYLMFAVATQKEVRDAGQVLAQKVQEAGTVLSLNEEVYRALKVVDVSGADAATRHYMERTLLEYRLAGVDR